ncbi:MAG: MFS transporter [Thermostichales cyanobacterium GMQP_bins_62]
MSVAAALQSLLHRWGLAGLVPQLWLLLLGRLLSQMGTGFTLFYAAIYFVGTVGLTATQVGLGLALMSLTGVVGRIAGGSLADGRWGRKQTLLVALLTSGLGSLLLALSQDVNLFWLANGVAGLGQGLYWPSAEAMVADLATVEQRGVAFALNRLSDNVGLSVGVALGGVWVARTGNYPLLFVIDAISYGVFALLVVTCLQETRPHKSRMTWQSWLLALQDRPLLIFCAANILLTTYLSQLSSTLPFYLQRFVGIPLEQISGLFTLHVLVSCLLQLPAVRLLRRFTHRQGLQATTLCWGLAFLGVVWTGQGGGIPVALLTLIAMAVALVLYNPSASAFVVSLAPLPLRGVYLSINSLCWAAGYALGPAVGGLILDQGQPLNLWWLWAASTLVTLAILFRIRQDG